MSYRDYLTNLLAPLGIYDLNAVYNGGELDSQGSVLDGVEAQLEENHREADLTCAECWGLEAVAQLLPRRPVTDDAAAMRAALAALLRIGGDSFTLAAVNDAILGCGVQASVAETGQPGAVEVSFPNVRGIPDGMEEIARIIEDILPAHVSVSYIYWYVSWEQLEEQVASWQDMETRELTWNQVETLVTEL